jgi:hypothetical protein
MLNESLLVVGLDPCEIPDGEDCRLTLTLGVVSDSVIVPAIKVVDIDVVIPTIFTSTTLCALAAAKMVDSLMT